MVNENGQRIAGNIDAARRMFRWNHYELGKRCGRGGSRKTIENWVGARLTGRTDISLDELYAFADALGIPVRPLTGERQYMLKFIAGDDDLLNRASRRTACGSGAVIGPPPRLAPAWCLKNCVP
jgi:hypothetical protein